MISSNLIQLLCKFNPAEFKEFGEYIRSSFFNKNEGVVKLYDFIKIYYPDLSEINFEKEYVYKSIFPKVEYDDAFMRKLMFNLAKLAEDYLVYVNLFNNSFSYSKSLLDELLKRDLKKTYIKKLKSLEVDFSKQKFRDVEYYKNKFFVDSFKETILTQERAVVNTKDKPEIYIINNTESLIKYFLIEILQEYRFLITYKKIVRFDFDSEFYKLILNYLKKNEGVNNIPLISIYYNSILLIMERKESQFKKLKKSTIKELDSLSFSDRYSTFAILVNFANEEYQRGNKKYIEEAFELYKLILENKLYSGIEGGAFYNPLFRNIVNVGLLMKDVIWTENFIKTFASKLLPEARDSTLYLSRARLNFVKGDYDKSLEDLSKISSINYFQIKPSIKALTLMIYIENGWYDEAVDLIDAYRHYISYEKLLTDTSKEKNMNFIKFCNEIIKMKSKISKAKINDIKFDLINTENILDKEWLEEKFAQMEIRVK